LAAKLCVHAAPTTAFDSFGKGCGAGTRHHGRPTWTGDMTMGNGMKMNITNMGMPRP